MGVIPLGLTLEMLVSENSFARRLEKQMDFDWLIGQVKPYFPDAQDRTAAPVRALCLVLLEHLEPYGLPCGDKPFLASVYENWRDNNAYMWLLQGVPWDIPAYQHSPILETFRPLRILFIPLPISSRRKCCGKCWPTS